MDRFVYDQERDPGASGPVLPRAPLNVLSGGAVHPLWHFCARCIGAGKVVFIALIVELITFWPTHWFFHEIGWL